MNQKIINVVLTAEGEEDDLLYFNISETCILTVNLNNSSCQNEIKRVFSALLEESLHGEIKLVLEFQEGYSRQMYKEVCTEYISDINRELQDARTKLIQELERP